MLISFPHHLQPSCEHLQFSNYWKLSQKHQKAGGIAAALAVTAVAVHTPQLLWSDGLHPSHSPLGWALFTTLYFFKERSLNSCSIFKVRQTYHTMYFIKQTNLCSYLKQSWTRSWKVQLSPWQVFVSSAYISRRIFCMSGMVVDTSNIILNLHQTNQRQVALPDFTNYKN